MNDLAPQLFSDFVGQKRVKARLMLTVAAAKQRREAVSHILLTGSPGLGKATLACIIAKATGSNLKNVTDGSIIQKVSDLAGLLTNLEEEDVLFIDEIHHLPKIIEEQLCFAMKNFKLDVIIDTDSNRSVLLNLPRFTVIGSAPRKEKLSTALLSCFPIIENFDNYSIEEMAIIACRFAKLLKMEIDEAVDIKIARSSDGTPLDILNRLQHLRDYAHVKGGEKITLDIATSALEMLASSEMAEVNQGRLAISSEVRREVWRRDEGKCTKCGNRENLEYDHIIPFSKGGSNTARNIELLCEACNRAKSASIQ